MTRRNELQEIWREQRGLSAIHIQFLWPQSHNHRDRHTATADIFLVQAQTVHNLSTVEPAVVFIIC